VLRQHNTVAKLMRQAAIMPRCIRRFRVTTDRADPKIHRTWCRAIPCAKALRLLVKRITYNPTREGWLPGGYSGLVLRVRCWLGDEQALGTKLAMDALEMALRPSRQRTAILHSTRFNLCDVGLNRDVLSRHHIRQAESARKLLGQRPMESFFHTLKTELVMHHDYELGTKHEQAS